MEVKKVTHWTNWNEWKLVVDSAYDNDLNINRQALSHIFAWEARDGNIPSALVCLKELLLAKVYEIDKQTASIENMRAYQSTLALCIIRFVNFITEPYQKSLMSRAIKTIGNEIGLPDWIVNMRHNSTHYNMPSVEVLEEALCYLFKWLKERYVNKYTENPIDNLLLDNVQIQIRELLDDYLNLKYKNVVHKKGKTNAHRIEVSTHEDKIETFLMYFKDQTLKTLLLDSYLIPTREQLKGIGLIADEFLETNDVELPQAFIKIWTQTLNTCNQLNLLGTLFKLIVSNYEQEKSNGVCLRSKFLLCWIYYFIRLNSTQPLKYEIHFNFKEVLLKVLKSNTNELNLIFLEKISLLQLCQKNLDNLQMSQLKQLVRLLCSKSDRDYHVTNAIKGDKFNTHSLKDYTPHVIFTGQNMNLQEEDEMNGKWRLVKDDNWNVDDHKLGLLDCQSYQNLNLTLKNNVDSHGDENDRDENYIDSQLKSNDFMTNDKFEVLKGQVMQSFWQYSDSRMH